MNTTGHRLPRGMLALPLVLACCTAPPAAYESLLSEAETGLQAGQPDRAWDAAVAAVEIDALRPEAYVALMRVARDHGRCDAALPLLASRVELGGDDVARYHYFLGLLQMDCDRHREAESSLRRAVELEPRSAQAWLELGGLLGREGRLEEAAELLREVAPGFPERPDLDTRLGHLLIKLRRWDEAVRVLSGALERHPDHARARFLLGLAWINDGQPERARPELERTVEIAPDYTVGWYQLAWVYDRLGETELRERALDRFTEAYREHGAAF